MSARRDVDQVFLIIRIKWVSAREFEKCFVYPLEVPRIAELNMVKIDSCFGRDRRDIVRHAKGQRLIA